MVQIHVTLKPRARKTSAWFYDKLHALLRPNSLFPLDLALVDRRKVTSEKKNDQRKLFRLRRGMPSEWASDEFTESPHRKKASTFPYTFFWTYSTYRLARLVQSNLVRWSFRFRQQFTPEAYPYPPSPPLRANGLRLPKVKYKNRKAEKPSL